MSDQSRPISAERLAEIRARADAASPGPWPLPGERVAPSWAGSGNENYDSRLPVDHEGCDEWPWERFEDMAFAYRARDDVPDLLDEIERLNAEVMELKRANGNG